MAIPIELVIVLDTAYSPWYYPPIGAMSLVCPPTQWRKDNMTSVPSPVIELVETFDRGIDTYRSPQYNETQLRREFIDPFFEQLGWDIANKAGHAHAYKDVIHEDAISVGSATKAPDEKTKIQRQIDTTDRQIDQLIYKLYKLTDEEIKIVEGTG